MKSVVFGMGDKYPKYQLGYDQYPTWYASADI